MENWKPVIEYEGIYEVSDLGQVRRIKPEANTFVGKILSGGIDSDGYRVVLLYNCGKRKMFKVHRLVAIAFVDNPDGRPQVNHKNAIKLDNRSENLEWCDCQHNITHAVDSGLWNAAKGEKHGGSKLTEVQVKEIRKLAQEGVSNPEIAAKFGVSQAATRDIIVRKNWAWLE